MRHAIILAHPNPQSFNASAARAYVEAVRRLGDEADLRDLYALDFDPRLRATELPWSPGFTPGPDVITERVVIAGAHVICLVYPFWFNAPPAMIWGYVERVFGQGFGYETGPQGMQPRMGGKLLLSVTTSGAPNAWVDQSGALARLRAGFDDHLAAVLGLSVLDHLHLGGVTPGIREDAAEDLLSQVTAMAERLFHRSGD